MDSKAFDTAYVYKGETRIGTLRRTAHGAEFSYDQINPAKEGVAYSMPPTQVTYQVSGNNLHPFFAGLLPEGLRLQALRSVVKTSADDLFSLLLGSGGDTIGDISLSTSDKRAPAAKHKAYELGEVNFLELFERSIKSEDPAMRARDLTVAGVQPKISAGMISFPVQVKMRRRFCILKLTPQEYPRIAENEYFFTQMARACGLEVPQCSLVRDRDGQTGLLLERFDRRSQRRGTVSEKVHQEDACQFLDRYPADKYRIGMGEIADGIVERSSAPIVEVAKLLRLVAFSYLIGNGDLHAKNISLATDPGTGSIRLTPAYDLVSTWPYGDRSMALQFEGRNDNLKRRDFINFGARYGVREAVVHRILSELTQNSAEWIPRLGEIGFDTKQTSDLQKLMLKRAADLAKVGRG